MGTTQNHLLVWARQQLGALEGADPLQDARILLQWVLGGGSLWQLPPEVSDGDAARFCQAVARRAAHEPLQYITGEMFFRRIRLRCRPGVFICRPETEVVAGVAVQHARQLADQGLVPRVIDVCAGSGAIACSIADEVPGAHVDAIEITRCAAELAKENSRDIVHGRVCVIHGDFHTIPATGGYHIVVSNPPYVADGDVTQREAQRDPDIALYGGGDDGTYVPRDVIHRATTLLLPGGLLVMEHAEHQSSALRDAAAHHGFIRIHTGRDLAGRDRYLYAERPR